VLHLSVRVAETMSLGESENACVMSGGDGGGDFGVVVVLAEVHVSDDVLDDDNGDFNIFS